MALNDTVTRLGNSIINLVNSKVAAIKGSVTSVTKDEYTEKSEAGTIDEDTYYAITDDTDTTLTLLNTIYPVGSLYLTTNSTCPLEVLGVGTWVLEAADRVLQGAGSRGAVGTTVDESLPNILASPCGVWRSNILSPSIATGAIKIQEKRVDIAGSGGSDEKIWITNFNASLSSSTYQDGAPVQQNAYLINVYRRIA